jgi:RNA polymerase sigma factor (sigma-70 family)
MDEVVQHLRQAVLKQDGAGLSDGELLGYFVEQQNETAVAALVRRHGPMVWGVCRRVLRNDHDAEDAFQATFLVLVRRAASITPREMVGNWLYGVAHKTALKARAMRTKRQAKETQVTEMPEPTVAQQNHGDDLQEALDQELSRLPDKYRVAIVLCDLEGKTRKEASHQLGVPEGTLAARLARAREMLAKRLARHGLAVSVTSVAAVLSQQAAAACLPRPVVSSTIKYVIATATGQAAGLVSAKVTALTGGVLKMMTLSHFKTMTVLLAAALGAGAAGLTYQAKVSERVDMHLAAADSAAGQRGPTEKSQALVKPIKRPAQENKQAAKKTDKQVLPALPPQELAMLPPLPKGVAEPVRLPADDLPVIGTIVPNPEPADISRAVGDTFAQAWNIAQARKVSDANGLPVRVTVEVETGPPLLEESGAWRFHKDGKPSVIVKVTILQARKNVDKKRSDTPASRNFWTDATSGKQYFVGLLQPELKAPAQEITYKLTMMRGKGTERIIKAFSERRLQLTKRDGRLTVAWDGKQEQLSELALVVKALQERRLQMREGRTTLPLDPTATLPAGGGVVVQYVIGETVNLPSGPAMESGFWTDPKSGNQYFVGARYCVATQGDSRNERRNFWTDPRSGNQYWVGVN